MANNANIRFSNANVAYVNIDTETHAITGGVMDETTGTFYPIGGGSSLFETVELKINLAEGFSYDLIAPRFFTMDEDSFIISIDENLEDPEGVYDIIIPTNGSTFIQIKPSMGSNIVIVSGDITQDGANSFTITGNAEVAIQQA